jgi:hypothetical protein
MQGFIAQNLMSTQSVYAMHSSSRSSKENATQFLRTKVVKGLLLVGIFFLSIFQSVQAQIIKSVSFSNGAIGVQGNNPQQLNNLRSFQTLQI